MPNKRLKLAGGDRFKGCGVFVPWRARTNVQHICALRASRPQLKRDPLGGSQALSQGDVAMQLTPLLSLYAVVTGLFAVALLIVPSQLMSVYGAAHLDTLQTILSRFIGSLFAGLAVMAWTARASEAGRAREAIVLGLTILNGLSAVVAVLAALSGVFNALAWGQAGLYALFTVFFVIAGRASMSPRARAS